MKNPLSPILPSCPNQQDHAHAVTSLCSTASNASVELDNILDILLQDAETAACATSTTHDCHQEQYRCQAQVPQQILDSDDSIVRKEECQEEEEEEQEQQEDDDNEMEEEEEEEEKANIPYESKDVGDYIMEMKSTSTTTTTDCCKDDLNPYSCNNNAITASDDLTKTSNNMSSNPACCASSVSSSIYHDNVAHMVHDEHDIMMLMMMSKPMTRSCDTILYHHDSTNDAVIDNMGNIHATDPLSMPSWSTMMPESRRLYPNYVMDSSSSMTSSSVLMSPSSLSSSTSSSCSCASSSSSSSSSMMMPLTMNNDMPSMTWPISTAMTSAPANYASMTLLPSSIASSSASSSLPRRYWAGPTLVEIELALTTMVDHKGISSSSSSAPLSSIPTPATVTVSSIPNPNPSSCINPTTYNTNPISYLNLSNTEPLTSSIRFMDHHHHHPHSDLPTSATSTPVQLAATTSSSNSNNASGFNYWSLMDMLSNTSAIHQDISTKYPFNIEDDRISAWRRLHKRSSMEPRYTVKFNNEEAAISDGYRWRKYGQKSIKNSPYPRSYYRCSTGKCNVKKQVERCTEDCNVFVVTYEGVHLHHRL